MCEAIRLRLACGWASLLLALLAGRPLGATEVEADSTRTVRSEAATLPSAHGALLRSAVLPGWGQFYNGRPVKGLFFGAASATALTATLVEHRRIRSAPTPEDHQDRTARRNSRLLYFALSVALAAIDAYVDAHLADFGTVRSDFSAVRPPCDPASAWGPHGGRIGVEMRRNKAWLRMKMPLP